MRVTLAALATVGVSAAASECSGIGSRTDLLHLPETSYCYHFDLDTCDNYYVRALPPCAPMSVSSSWRDSSTRPEGASTLVPRLEGALIPALP